MIEESKELKIINNKRYIIIITISIIIILISLISVIIMLIRHNNIIKNYEDKIKRIEIFEELKKREKEKEKQKRLQKIEEQNKNLKLISIAQKEINGFKYNKSAQKEIDKIYDLDIKYVYLTFDDGPSRITKEVLDILKEENIPATFFIVGAYIEGNEDIIRRIYNEGHTIGNHSFSHKYNKIYKSSEETLKEYNQTEKELKKILGNEFNTKLFRFPGGSFGGEYHNKKQIIKNSLKEKNIAFVDWNVLTNDSVGADTFKLQLKEFNRTRKDKKSIIVLQHDSYKNINLPQTLKSIIKTLKNEGYIFKNFNDILVKKK